MAVQTITYAGYLLANGSFVLNYPDSTVAGGNARGVNAVDLQLNRAAAAQVASGQNSVTMGLNCLASGFAATAIGNTNTAGNTASVALGQTSTAAGPFSLTHGNNGSDGNRRNARVFGYEGTKQAEMQCVEQGLSAKTTDATVTRLTENRAAADAFNTMNLPNTSTATLEIMVTARQTGGAAGTAGDSASWKARVTIKRGANAAATSFIGGHAYTSAPALAAVVAGTGFAPFTNDAAAAAWRVTLNVDTTNGGLLVSGTGEASKNITWVAQIISVEATS